MRERAPLKTAAPQSQRSKHKGQLAMCEIRSGLAAAKDGNDTSHVPDTADRQLTYCSDVASFNLQPAEALVGPPSPWGQPSAALRPS